jgi:hypothetical protein
MSKTQEERDQEMYDEIYAALCCNQLTDAVASFLADLAVRIRRIERNET